MTFINLGVQFVVLQTGRRQPSDDGRQFGLVVDDKDAVCQALAVAGVPMLSGRCLDFFDPWRGRLEIVEYDNIQFSRAPNVSRGMGLTHSSKKQLAEKGMAPE